MDKYSFTFRIDMKFVLQILLNYGSFLLESCYLYFSFELYPTDNTI